MWSLASKRRGDENCLTGKSVQRTHTFFVSASAIESGLPIDPILEVRDAHWLTTDHRIACLLACSQAPPVLFSKGAQRNTMLAAAMAAAATGAASTASTRAQNHAQNQQIMEQVEQIEKAAEQRGLQRAEEKLRQRRKEGGEGESSQSESGERSKLPANGAKKPRKSKKSSKHADKQRPQRPELNTMRGQSDFSAESFFATQQEPPTLAKTRKLAQDFVEMHNKAGRHVVLVTSGGTTVPLEQNVYVLKVVLSAGGFGLLQRVLKAILVSSLSLAACDSWTISLPAHEGRHRLNIFFLRAMLSFSCTGSTVYRRTLVTTAIQPIPFSIF